MWQVVFFVQILYGFMGNVGWPTQIAGWPTQIVERLNKDSFSWILSYNSCDFKALITKPSTAFKSSALTVSTSFYT